MLWTILNKSGSRAVDFTSMLSLEVSDQGQAVSTPIEEGSFANYNKVQSPTEIKVSLALEGEGFVLDQALKTLESLQKGTELLSLSTPSAYYDSLTLKAHSHKRENTSGFLTVDLSLVEVRQVGGLGGVSGFGLGQVKNALSAVTQNLGKVQAVVTNLNQLALLKSNLQSSLSALVS